MTDLTDEQLREWAEYELGADDSVRMARECLRHRARVAREARLEASEKCVRLSDGIALLTEAFNALGNLLFDKPGAQDLTLHDRIGKFLHARIEAQRPVREEVMRLMREDFDPTPPNWEGRDWEDNAEDVADKIIALFPSTLAQPAESAARPSTDAEREQLARFSEAEAPREQSADTWSAARIHQWRDAMGPVPAHLEQSAASVPTPFTHVYHYPWHDGGSVIRYGTQGRCVNGSAPIEAIPLYDEAALRQARAEGQAQERERIEHDCEMIAVDWRDDGQEQKWWAFQYLRDNAIRGARDER